MDGCSINKRHEKVHIFNERSAEIVWYLLLCPKLPLDWGRIQASASKLTPRHASSFQAHVSFHTNVLGYGLPGGEDTEIRLLNIHWLLLYDDFVALCFSCMSTGKDWCVFCFINALNNLNNFCEKLHYLLTFIVRVFHPPLWVRTTYINKMLLSGLQTDLTRRLLFQGWSVCFIVDRWPFFPGDYHL